MMRGGFSGKVMLSWGALIKYQVKMVLPYKFVSATREVEI